MDFLMFWVSLGITVEVLRRSYKRCHPQTINRPNTIDESLKEPLLRDGKCPYSCCAKLVAPDAGASASESHESVSSEEYSTDSSIDLRKGKHLVKDDGMRAIVGRVHPTGNGGPKFLHFQVSDNAAAKREASAKVHPQPFNGTAKPAEASTSISSPQWSKDTTLASVVFSDDYRLKLPPIQEAMYHGNSPGGDEIQPAEGQCSYQVD